jgi:hypothetical protein
MFPFIWLYLYQFLEFRITWRQFVGFVRPSALGPHSRHEELLRLQNHARMYLLPLISIFIVWYVLLKGSITMPHDNFSLNRFSIMALRRSELVLTMELSSWLKSTRSSLVKPLWFRLVSFFSFYCYNIVLILHKGSREGRIASTLTRFIRPTPPSLRSPAVILSKSTVPRAETPLCLQVFSIFFNFFYILFIFFLRWSDLCYCRAGPRGHHSDPEDLPHQLVVGLLHPARPPKGPKRLWISLV